MKSVLISIQPYWVFLIIAKIMGWNIDKEKTVEVRKNYPKAENWNKTVKIYCSKDKKSFSKIPKEYQSLMERFLGKVIGEFVCTHIFTYEPGLSFTEKDAVNSLRLLSCLSTSEIWDYSGNGKKTLYGWRISDIVIYDEPCPLSAFRSHCVNDLYCEECGMYSENTGICGNAALQLTRPPQSWCYVEDEDGK